MTNERCTVALHDLKIIPNNNSDTIIIITII